MAKNTLNLILWSIQRSDHRSGSWKCPREHMRVFLHWILASSWCFITFLLGIWEGCRLTKGCWRCSCFFISPDAWNASSNEISSKLYTSWKRCWIWGQHGLAWNSIVFSKVLEFSLKIKPAKDWEQSTHCIQAIHAVDFSYYSRKRCCFQSFVFKCLTHLNAGFNHAWSPHWHVWRLGFYDSRIYPQPTATGHPILSSALFLLGK